MEIVQTALMTSESSEGGLLPLARAGDAAAFAALYRRHADAVYRYALHMSGNPSIADEVLQETFLALIRDSSGFDAHRGSLAGYIYGIARNRVRKHIAWGREFVETSSDEPDDTDVLSDLTRRETVDAVRQAVLALPGQYREVIVLCELQELRYEEAAVVIGCPVGTVRSRLHRARTMLLTKLQALKRNRILV